MNMNCFDWASNGLSYKNRSSILMVMVRQNVERLYIERLKAEDSTWNSANVERLNVE